MGRGTTNAIINKLNYIILKRYRNIPLLLLTSAVRPKRSQKIEIEIGDGYGGGVREEGGGEREEATATTTRTTAATTTAAAEEAAEEAEEIKIITTRRRISRSRSIIYPSGSDDLEDIGLFDLLLYPCTYKDLLHILQQVKLSSKTSSKSGSRITYINNTNNDTMSTIIDEVYVLIHELTQVKNLESWFIFSYPRFVRLFNKLIRDISLRSRYSVNLYLPQPYYIITYFVRYDTIRLTKLDRLAYIHPIYLTEEMLSRCFLLAIVKKETGIDASKITIPIDIKVVNTTDTHDGSSSGSSGGDVTDVNPNDDDNDNDDDDNDDHTNRFEFLKSIYEYKEALYIRRKKLIMKRRKEKIREEKMEKKEKEKEKNERNENTDGATIQSIMEHGNGYGSSNDEDDGNNNNNNNNDETKYTLLFIPLTLFVKIIYDEQLKSRCFFVEPNIYTIITRFKGKIYELLVTVHLT